MSPRSPVRLRAHSLVCIALVAAALGPLATVARADGDPASDVLAGQSLFPPTDAHASARQLAQLQAVLTAASRDGYPVRLALIASAADLGSVTELWRRPDAYARFLGQELSLISHARVLVAMPNGFGLYVPGARAAAEQAAVRQLSLPGRGTGLAVAALAAVERLAGASGHEIPSSVAAGVRAPGAAMGTGTTDDLTAWLVFALGGLLIVAAWIASLSARPVTLRGRRAEG